MTFKEFLQELEIANKNSYLHKNEDCKFSYIAFELAKEIYAIDTDYVEEVVVIKGIMDSPDTPDYIKGIIGYKGALINAIDLRMKLNIEEKAYDYRTSIIIINVNDYLIGLIVDDVINVTNISYRDIEYFHNIKSSSNESGFIKGAGRVGNKSIKILDLNKVLYQDQSNMKQTVVN